MSVWPIAHSTRTSLSILFWISYYFLLLYFVWSEFYFKYNISIRLPNMQQFGFEGNKFDWKVWNEEEEEGKIKKEKQARISTISCVRIHLWVSDQSTHNNIDNRINVLWVTRLNVNTFNTRTQIRSGIRRAEEEEETIYRDRTQTNLVTFFRELSTVNASINLVYETNTCVSST